MYRRQTERFGGLIVLKLKISDKVICRSGNDFVVKVFRGVLKQNKNIYNYDEFGNELDVRTTVEETIFLTSFPKSIWCTGNTFPPKVFDEKVWKQIQANINNKRKLWKQNEKLFKSLKTPTTKDCEKVKQS